MRALEVSQETRISAVTDCREVFGIELGEERITIAQVRIMRAQAALKSLAALADCVEAAARSCAVTIVSPQIAKRSFAFKDRCQSSLFSLPSIRRYVGTIPALRQSNFHRARGKAVRLCPQQCEPLQFGVSRRFAAMAYYSRNHFAISVAQ